MSTQTTHPTDPMSSDEIITEASNANSPENIETVENHESLLQAIGVIEEEKKALQDQVLRLSADLQNIKRRTESERIKARFDGGASVILDIAKTIDDLHRAFAHIPQDIAMHPFIASLQAIEKNLQKTMEAQDIIFFGQAGDIFDEKYHESLMMDPTTSENTVAQVFEQGIMFRKEVIRHAKVSVGTKPIIPENHEKNS